MVAAPIKAVSAPVRYPKILPVVVFGTAGELTSHSPQSPNATS